MTCGFISGAGETASLTQPMPFAGMAQQPVFDFADDFTADRLRPEWTWNYPYATPEIELADGASAWAGGRKRA